MHDDRDSETLTADTTDAKYGPNSINSEKYFSF